MDDLIKKIEALPDDKRICIETWAGSVVRGQTVRRPTDFNTNDLKALATRITALEAALREYADPDNWLCSTCDDPLAICTTASHRVKIWDGGTHGPDIARKYLDGEDSTAQAQTP